MQQRNQLGAVAELENTSGLIIRVTSYTNELENTSGLAAELE